MSAVTNKIRIYDLAREVKQDTKRILEEVRREGIDASVPSNTVPKDIAEKIRNRYFPKKEAPAVARKIQIVKKAPVAATEEAAPVIADTNNQVVGAPPAVIAEQVAPPIIAEKAIVTTAKAAPEKETAPPRTVRLVAKPIPAKVEVETPPVVEAVIVAPPVTEPQPTIETVASEVLAAEQTQTVAEAAPVAAAPTPDVQRHVTPGKRITTLKLTKAALQSGLKAGERVQVAPPPQVAAPAQPAGDRQQDRFGRNQNQRSGFDGDRRPLGPRGTPGETATPQTTYTPPPSQKKPGRKGFVKGGDRNNRDNRFAERDLGLSPRPLTLEERMRQRAGVEDGGDLKSVRLVEGATVRDFAEKLGIIPKEVVQLLIKRGVFATVNQPLNLDVAVDIGKMFGFDVAFVPYEAMVEEEEFDEIINTGGDDVEITRAPVVTVMGHVDHGKTSLLDGIRNANVAAGEAGGITQHIGAYSVSVPSGNEGGEMRRVVFLDTPGHEAFTMMRSRGAKATDVVILVVAADDGVMPQTIEAIEHAKAAKVPLVVAINKIDKPDANADKVKQELTAYGLNPVEWGGETEMVPVSAKKSQNIDTLLETVLLTSDILNLKASPTRLAAGVVLEAKLDRGRGAVATVLVQQGTLRIGDPFIVGQFAGKVRAMFNDRGQNVDEAEPSTPVEILGLQGVPQAGDTFQVVADVDRAQQISQQRQMQVRQASLVKTTARGLESLGQAGFKELLVVLKTDVQGSVEVLRATLEKLSTEKVKVRVIRSGVGAITESDVLLASATQADNMQTAVVIIGFNVRPEARASEVAKNEDVDIRLHSIIYKVEEEIRAAMIGMLDAIEKEVILGHALVLQAFKVTKVGVVAGCRVLDGIIRRTAKARLIRDGVVAWEGEIESLKRVKDDASEVREGFECGIGLHNFNDIKVNDQIEAYIIESIAATEL